MPFTNGYYSLFQSGGSQQQAPIDVGADYQDQSPALFGTSSTSPLTFFLEDFEGGTNGSAVTSSNTNFDVIQTGFTFANSPTAITGSLALQSIAPASTGEYVQSFFAGSTQQLFVCCYVYLPAIASAAVDFMASRGGGGAGGRIGINGGKFVARDGSTIVWTSTTSVPNAGWMRLEWKNDVANSVQEFRVFLGANLHGSTPDETSGSVSFTPTLKTIDMLRMGPVNNSITSSWTSYYDAVAFGSYDWIGPAVTTVTVSADLSGTGTLSAVGIPIQTSAVSLSGTGTLTATSVVVMTAAASLTGTGTLSAIGIPVQTSSVNLSGTGTLSAAPIVLQTTAASLSGTGALTAVGIPIQTSSVNLSGSGTLTAAAIVVKTIAAAVSGTGTLSATNTPLMTLPVNLSGTGTLSAAAFVLKTIAASLSGTGTLTATAAPSLNAALSGTGTLTQTNTPRLIVNASLTSNGVLSATVKLTLSAALSGTGTLSAVGIPKQTVNASASGTGTLSASAVVVQTITASASGTGTLTQTNTPKLTVTAALSGSGTLTASARIVVSVNLSGTGTLTAVVVVQTVEHFSGVARYTTFYTAARTEEISFQLTTERIFTRALYEVISARVIGLRKGVPVNVTRISRKTVDIAVTATSRTGAGVSISGVDVALLTPRSFPTTSTTWTASSYAAGKATIVLVGPDASVLTGALLVPTGGADMWIRIADNPDVDAVRVERVNLLED